MKKKIIAVLLLVTVFMSVIIPLSVCADVKTTSVNNWGRWSGIKYSSSTSEVSTNGKYECYNSYDSKGDAKCIAQYAAAGAGWREDGATNNITLTASPGNASYNTTRGASVSVSAFWRVALWATGDLTGANATIRV